MSPRVLLLAVLVVSAALVSRPALAHRRSFGVLTQNPHREEMRLLTDDSSSDSSSHDDSSSDSSSHDDSNNDNSHDGSSDDYHDDSHDSSDSSSSDDHSSSDDSSSDDNHDDSSSDDNHDGSSSDDNHDDSSSDSSHDDSSSDDSHDDSSSDSSHDDSSSDSSHDDNHYSSSSDGSSSGGGLSYNYYASTCPKAAEIVAARVYQAYKNDPAVPAPLLRLHFHDCFVQGCDASVLLDSTEDNKAEKDSDPNATLGAFDVVDDIKDHLEAECPGVVSCADILALAAREGIHLAGGPFTEVPLGRRDGLTSFALAAETFLPGSTLNVSGLVHNFNTVGLDMTDVVTLSGAHTIGEGRCVSLKNRLEQDDPTMDPEFAAYVKQKCGTSNIDPKAMIENDYASPNKFDNQYYKNLLAHKGLFTTDQALIYDDKTEKAVKAFAHAKSVWFDAFPKSLVKMGVISPLTGTQGEVRLNCHVRNTY